MRGARSGYCVLLRQWLQVQVLLDSEKSEFIAQLEEHLSLLLLPFSSHLIINFTVERVFSTPFCLFLSKYKSNTIYWGGGRYTLIAGVSRLELGASVLSSFQVVAKLLRGSNPRPRIKNNPCQVTNTGGEIMKILKCNLYYCDFCGKSELRKAKG